MIKWIFTIRSDKLPLIFCKSFSIASYVLGKGCFFIYFCFVTYLLL